MSEEELKRQTRELLDKVKKYNSKADLKFIEKAVYFAYDAHKGQKRFSGEEYFTHCYSVGITVADLKMDYHSVAVALLHDVIEDTNIKPERIEKEFDKETVELILALTKLKRIDEKAQGMHRDELRSENIRKIILATAKDIRVIIIKLADRLHNMRTLKYSPEDRQKVIAKETLEIYAPIAHKLGINIIKSELEDLSLRFLEPKIYNEFKKKIATKRAEREKEIERIIKEIKEELKKNNIEAEVYGRAKHFYSIYKKIIKEGKEFSEVYDLNAIRIIARSIPDCYAALGLVHKIWKPIPKRFKDYIAIPKANNYQSLHTTVIGSHGKILEVQIRTKEMHIAAEEGIAAHWRYKELDEDKRFDRQMEWLKQIIDWKRKSDDANEFVELLKVDPFEKEIFVFTPKGDPIVLQEGSNPIDFAYAIHTDVGNHCKQAKVNGTIVPLDQKLSPGDIVEIMTAKNASPSRSWLSLVKSADSIIKIKKALGIEYSVTPKHKDKDKETEKSGLEFKDGHILYNGKKPNLKIPKCCNPKVGDNIRAFKTKDGKIAIHKAKCINLHAYDISQEIKPKISETKNEILSMHIEVTDKVGMMAEILTVIAKDKFNVKKINTKFGKNNNAIISIDITKDNLVKNRFEVNELMEKIRKISSVQRATIEN